MKCTPKKGKGIKTCTIGKRTFKLHPGKSNHAAKVRRGKALHRKYVCTKHKSGSKKGLFKECHLRGGK